jgi:zinc transporter, ZIP family
VLVDVVAEAVCHPADRALETRVRERLDLAAVAADEVVVMVAVRRRRLVTRDPVSCVDALYEPQLRDFLDHPVDGRDPDRALRRAEPIEDLLRAQAALLATEQLDHGAARSAGAIAGLVEDSERVFCPGHGPSVSFGDDENRSHSAAWIAIPLAGVTVLSTLAGGLLALRLRRELATLIALTGGIVVAVALFDVLPEALTSLGEPRNVLGVVGGGFLAFFIAERLLVLHHRDEPEQARAHGRVGALGAAGLSVHSLIDGLGIGLAFHVSAATGLLVFLAVVSHDFADGMNTVSFVLFQSDNRRQALRWLSADALAPLIGAVIGSAVSISARGLGYVLAIYAGFFLSMGATDLLPEAHSHPSWKRVALTVLGFAATFAIARAAT